MAITDNCAPDLASVPARRHERPLRTRWLGKVQYQEALDLQKQIHRVDNADHLLLLEHPHVFTLGLRGDPGNILVDPASVGAEVVRANRGGDVTYHGPGQLVGYPIMSLAGKGGGSKPDSAAYVHAIEQAIIDSLETLGLPGAGRLCGLPGVWLDAELPSARKIAAIGVRLSKGRSMHGFALNVDADLAFFGHIIPCGIPDKAVTSMAAEGVAASMHDVVDEVFRQFEMRWGGGDEADRQDLAWRVNDGDMAAFTRREPADDAPSTTSVRIERRLAEAGVTNGLQIAERKPKWMRAKARMGPDYLRLKKVMRDRSLVTVCEEAKCPNIYECWSDGTATFMVLGERCTRACGFCEVDTRHPLEVDVDEPARVADAVVQMGLEHAVITMVARDDLADGGAAIVAATIDQIRSASPGTAVEVLISDLRGSSEALDVVLAARPDIVNHNIETVLRLQRAVRPSAAYARSLTLLARSKQAGLTTKSGLIVGMGETDVEVSGCLADLASIGTDVVTIGQYLRPSTRHLPVERWVTPEQFDNFKAIGEAMGIGHVESSPLTRSSYHAKDAAASL